MARQAPPSSSSSVPRLPIADDARAMEHSTRRLVKQNWFIAAIVIGVLAIVIAAIAMRLSDDGSSSTVAWDDPVATRAHS